MPGVGAALRRISPARSGRCCGRSRSTPAVTDVYGDVARSTYHSLQLTAREAAVRRRVDRELQLHVQPDRRTISRREPATTSTRTGPSASTISRTSGTRWSSTTCRSARKASRAAATRSCGRSSRTGRSRASRSSGRAGRSASIGAACNLPNAGTCYADFNPGFTGAVRINGDYGDGDVLGADAAHLHRPQRVPVARGVHLRQHAADARVRPAQPELVQPGSQRPARLSTSRR